MKHVLPRLVRPQMPGWPWKSSSSSNVLLLKQMRNFYQLRNYSCREMCSWAQCADCEIPLWTGNPEGSRVIRLRTGPSAILVPGLHDNHLGWRKSKKQEDIHGGPMEHRALISLNLSTACGQTVLLLTCPVLRARQAL